MKVALVRSPCINLPYPPLIGLAYLNSVLKRAGHEAFIFDLNVELFHIVCPADRDKWALPDTPALLSLSGELFNKHNQLFKEYAKRILASGAEVVGFSVWDSNVLLSLEIAQEVKRLNSNLKVIFGGPECFSKWSGNSLIKNECVDLVVYGEAEDTFVEIVDYLQMTGSVGLHAGTLVKNNDSVIDWGRRAPVKNLDALPFPDFDGFPLEKYMTREIPIIFSRGCPRRCAYCSLPGTTPAYRWRSAVSIYEEFKYQINKYPHCGSFHCDSAALNANLKELSKLCDLIIQGGLKIRWSGFAMVDKQMDAVLLKKMQMAGCCGLNFGIESGSQQVVNKMRKGFHVEDAQTNLRDAHSLGIETVVNFIVGFPGESEDDFVQTLDFIVRNKPYISSVGSIAACWISPYSRINEYPEEFAVSRGPEAHDWLCPENNYQVRSERQKRLKGLLDSLGMEESFPKQQLDKQ